MNKNKDLPMTDYDDPEIEKHWFSERFFEVAEYLNREGILHGKIHNEPVWHIAPYVSIWAVDSIEISGKIGWWVISGDLPNDYVSANNAKTPREAMHAIASLWKEASEYMERGERHPTFTIGTGECDDELAPMLASRAEMLLEWSSDSEVWEESKL